MKKEVSAIIFDLGGVILNLDYHLTISAFKKIGPGNFDEMYSQAQQNKAFDKFETGNLSAQEFRDYLRRFLGENIANDTIDACWNAMLLDLPSERIAFLYELKKKYRIYLYSNTNAIHFSKFKLDLGKKYGSEDLLDAIFHKTYYSHLIGHRKPNGSAFQFILEEQNLLPEEVLFIDDSIQHVEGARSIGMHAEHLTDSDIMTLLNDYL